MTMAVLYKTNGTITYNVQPKTGKKFTLEELQAYVGGYIELIYDINGNEIYLNEEGKLKGLPINENACRFYAGFPHDVLVGDVLVCNREETP